MKTITQPSPYSFLEALQKLSNGECLGIRPEKNLQFMIPYRPYNPQSTDFCLIWSRAGEVDPQATSEARSDQYLGDWFLVIVDHRDLPIVKI